MIRKARIGSPYIKAVEAGIDVESIKKSIIDFYSKEREIFRLFEQKQIPLCSYITLMGSIGHALSKIRAERKGFILINDGREESFNYQKNVAEKALNGTSVYIDGTSLFMLIECGIVRDVLSKIPKYNIPASILKEYRSLIDKFSVVSEDGTLQVSEEREDVIVRKFSKDEAEEIRSKLVSDLKYIQDNAEDVYGIPLSEKHVDFIEQKISSIVSDACIKAQRDKDSVVLTEDSTYIDINSARTGKSRPDNFSVRSLVRCLWEKKEFDWEKYLNVFYILSIYRECFLPVTSDDLEQCLFEKRGSIITFTLEKFDKLNLNFVWSREYGVNFISLLGVSSDFISRLISDVSITDDILMKVLPKIFIPVLEGRDKRNVGDKLIKIVSQKTKSAFIITRSVKNRIDFLKGQIEDHINGITVIGT
ncbi:MAG: hypothetical protein HQ591_09875 [candidate division Zixibacteria bacterium]|nr:hypothetical protein [Candidatus Tariuqbacter arcticus]